MSAPIAATIRDDAAAFVMALTLVYTVLILINIVVSMYQTVGGRIPYNRPLRAVLDFVMELTEPVLRAARRVIPPIGPIDLSPLVVLLVLGFAGRLLASLIAG